MGTANNIITDALKLLGEWQKGEAPDADESADGLRALNLLIDSWANERLMLFQLVERTKALTANDGTYTIGTGGDIDTTRPVRIERAWVRDAENNDSVLAIIDNKSWSRIPIKSIQGMDPLYLYYRAAYPLGQINLYPLPGSGLTLYLQVWDQLTQFTALTTSASFPPGYERALIYNLAVEIAPMYGAVLRPEVVQVAVDSKAQIKTVNMVIPRMDTDLPIQTGVYYNDLIPLPN